MSRSSGVLQFILPTHENAVLHKMNMLREKHLFCDITILLRGPRGSAVQPVSFRGHKVVLAASSNFLRDQFLLHGGQAELSVGVVSDVNIAHMLLLTCYTGCLKVPFGELLSYLTAASVLQMSQVVEKCSQAVSQYLNPILAFLRLEGPSEEKEIQQRDKNRPGNRIETGVGEDAAKPNTSIQNTKTEERRADGTRSNSRVCQQGSVDGQSESRGRDGPTVMKVEKASSEEACCLDTQQSRETEGIHPLQTGNTLFHGHLTAGTAECKRHPPAIFHDLNSPAANSRSTSAADLEVMENCLNHQKAKEENMDMPVAQLQKERISDQFSQSAVAADDSYRTSAQRPYLCRRCEKVFQHFKSYVSHLKEHRQISCLVCGTGFSEKSHLLHHISIHTGVKPFRCPLCHRTFVQRTTLEDHLNLHTGGRSQENSHSAGLLTHKSSVCWPTREHHGETSQQNVPEKTSGCQ